MEPMGALKLIARAGYAARGVVYLIVGYFALLAAINWGKVSSTREALETILGQPHGVALLGLAIAGLLGHAGWRLAQSLLDADHHGADLKGLAVRAALLGSALVHLSLAVFAIGLILQWDASGIGASAAGWFAALAERGWARGMTLVLALVTLGVGIAHLVKGWRAGYERHFAADEEALARFRLICRLGLIARGLVFAVVATLTFYAGAIHDFEAAPGLDEALASVQALPFGGLLLAVMACGLLAFAFYSFAEAVYRRVDMRR